MKTLVIAAAIAWPAASLAQNSLSLKGMRAHLFVNDTATWSDDVLTRETKSLRNSFADSNAALVVVQVGAPPDAGRRTRYAVRLVATERGRAAPLLDRTQAIPLLNEQGKSSVAFLLYPGGCAPVRLKATLVGPQPVKPLEQYLDYACGE